MPSLPSAVFYGAGLFLYDFLAGRNRIQRHRHISSSALHRLEPRMARFSSGARFFDCLVHSARLVVLNIREACFNGAMALNYCAATPQRNSDGAWDVSLEDTLTGARQTITARFVVDATGAWSGEEGALRLVRGSHIVLRRITRTEDAISYFGRDGRIVFFIPWGPTNSSPSSAPPKSITPMARTTYTSRTKNCATCSALSKRSSPALAPTRPSPLTVRSALWFATKSASATSTSREHRIWADDDGMIHITGGKYTTYRAMSEEAVDLLARKRWPDLARLHLTAETHLPDPDEAPPESMDEPTKMAFAVRAEFVERLSDLLFVSTYWGYERTWDAAALEPYAKELARLLDWDYGRTQREIGDLLVALGRAPATNPAGAN